MPCIFSFSKLYVYNKKWEDKIEIIGVFISTKNVIKHKGYLNYMIFTKYNSVSYVQHVPYKP